MWEERTLVDVLMAVYLFNADLNGNDGIQHLIGDGRVKEFLCGSFEVFDEAAYNLMYKVTSEDFVIVDTLTALSDVTRADAKLGNDANELLWDKRDKLQGEAYGGTYEMARILIMRRLVNLRNRGAHIITTTHERDQRDDSRQIKQRGPQISPKFYSNLMGQSSDVFRMQVLLEPIVDNDGKVKVPVGTRTLQLRESEDYVAKYQVRRDLSDRIPRILYNPTWQKLCTTLGKVPSWLTIYGPPGVGKTTLITDMAETH